LTFGLELIYVNHNKVFRNGTFLYHLNIITIRFFLPGVTVTMVEEQGVAGNGYASHCGKDVLANKAG